MAAQVEIQNVSLVYPNGVRALTDVTLTVEAGEFVFLVGPTGHGKSTLLRLLNREEVATKGKVLVSGWDVAALSARRVPFLRRKVAVVFQDFRLLPMRTAWENIAFALRVTGKSHRAALRAVPEVLAQVGLLDKADDYPSELSAGEQQRLAIARAAATRPQLLLADEPTGSLDPQSSGQVINLLAEINAGDATVIVATHDPAIVNALRRRVVALREGRVVSDIAEGTYPADLMEPASPAGPGSDSLDGPPPAVGEKP